MPVGAGDRSLQEVLQVNLKIGPESRCPFPRTGQAPVDRQAGAVFQREPVGEEQVLTDVDTEGKRPDRAAL